MTSKYIVPVLAVMLLAGCAKDSSSPLAASSSAPLTVDPAEGQTAPGLMRVSSFCSQNPWTVRLSSAISI